MYTKYQHVKKTKREHQNEGLYMPRAFAKLMFHALALSSARTVKHE